MDTEPVLRGEPPATERPAALARVLDAARDPLADRIEAKTEAGDAARRIFDALAGKVGRIAPWTAPGKSSPPPAYRFLPAALERARAAPETALLAEAFAALEPALRWGRRPDSEAHGQAFHDGHANACLVGPTGLEERSDVLVGASLVAPRVRYVDHRHPPEEVYVVMSEGEWYREDRGWRAPGAGGIVYNPPNAVHAMRAGPAPLLALWLLPVG